MQHSAAELARYVSAAARATTRWPYSEHAKPLIDELVRLGLMEPAPNELVYEPASRIDFVEAFGFQIPVRGKLVSLYRLTALGEKTFRRKIRAPQTEKPPPQAANQA
jgi:hypothetical protein